MIDWLKKQWVARKRWKEAYSRGWASLGRMFANGSNWDDAKWSREIRRSNRLYRLTYGRSGPWKKHQGF